MFAPQIALAAADRRQLGGDPDWWRGGVIYQVYPRSFLDLSGDGVGDLPGITARLDYLAALGVDALWISPFFASPMADFGYDVSNYRAVDPLFGRIEDFDALLEGAHARGLRVILDLVLSHSSDKHHWFQESRADRRNARADWYVWADPKPDGTPPNNWLSIFGGSAWEWDSRRRQYYLHNFLASQPDLNLHDPAVQEAMLDIARFWLERGVDGFRLDTVNMYFHDAALRDNPPIGDGPIVNGMPEQNPYAMQNPIHNINRPETLVFLERLRALMNEYPATTTVGEIGCVTDMYATLAAYTEESRRLHMAYSFDYMGRTFTAGHIRQVSQRMAAQAFSWPSWAFSNHDVERAVSRWGLAAHGASAAPLIVALLTSLRGSPCLYQGEELGLPEAVVPYDMLRDPYGVRFWPEFKGRDGCRTPMPWNASAPHAGFSEASPWLPISPDHVERAVSLQEADPASTLSRTRAFLRWRRGRPDLAKGAIAFADTPEPVLAFRREHDGVRLWCVFNLGPDPVRLTVPGLDGGAALDGHGFAGRIEGGVVELAGFDALFAQS